MSAVFADTGYWIAVLLPGDHLYSRVAAMATTYDAAEVVTTQMVLTEVLNHVSRMGPRTRLSAAGLLEDLESNPNVEIVPQTDAQFGSAVERYASRGDQRWSLTDCASFLVMEERGITEALAYDRDFEQAGFTALLREAQG
ncbi:MAG: PIN domain-containing protein [Chloroflexi bacterium]|nr:PIN domain-containing protein [Chloroflexota bacterium]